MRRHPGRSSFSLDGMNMALPQDAEGSVTFLTSQEGGRSLPVPSGLRPLFHYDGRDWIAVLTFPDVELAELGATVRVIFSFLSPEAHYGKVVVGTPFLVREGTKVIGHGVITKLMDLADSARRARESSMPSNQRVWTPPSSEK
jgi:translation elongation factor EF-Tu-like GTPase